MSYERRVDALREAKRGYTREKQRIIGPMDYDDWGVVPPPEDDREVKDVMGASGEPITDILFKGFRAEPSHPNGGFYGPRAVGLNYRMLLEYHPVHIDPMSSLAGAYHVGFSSYHQPHWNPDFDYSDLARRQREYGIVSGIGGMQHFTHDLRIGLELGWNGLLEKVRRCRMALAPARDDFYAGLEDVILGAQDWIRRHAEAAARMAAGERDPELRANLEEMARVNEWVAENPPRSFREACQWILWFQMLARMFNNSGALGRLDLYLLPYYEADKKAGTLTDEEAKFHIACELLRVTDYIQVGGYDENGADTTNPVSYLVLEAAHWLKIPANVAIAVGKGIDPKLMRRGVEILFEDRLGIPKFVGLDPLIEDFAKNGYSVELARSRVYSGCHWFAVPGREYTMHDLIKVNFAKVFDVALRGMMADQGTSPSVEALWAAFERHLGRTVGLVAEGLDFHMDHMDRVYPELVLDLLCHGPVEKGVDASHGGVEFCNLCIDGSALATVADSFAAIEQRVEREGRMGWRELLRHLDEDWSGEGGEVARAMMRSVPRYGSGSSRADEYARRVVDLFSSLVSAKPTPAGHRMIPGLFSWASTLSMGKVVGATPNGRRAKAPISFGANPDPGFRADGALTALAVAVAGVQPHLGNPAPLQIEVDPGIASGDAGVDMICSLMSTHFELGGNEININIVNKEKVLEAYEDPSKYPDLVVRVTGFSAYFASLSQEMREVVVRRIVGAQ